GGNRARGPATRPGCGSRANGGGPFAPTVTPSPALERGVFRPCPILPGPSERAHAVEGLGEEAVLILGADGHPDRARRAEPVRRPDDHSFAQQPLEERPRVLADLREEEVADCRPGRFEPVLAQNLVEAGAALGVQGAPARELIRRVEAGKRRLLRGCSD